MPSKKIRDFKELEESSKSPNEFTRLANDLLSSYNSIIDLGNVYNELQDTFLKSLKDSDQWDYYYNYVRSSNLTFKGIHKYLFIDFCNVCRCFNDKLYDLLYIKNYDKKSKQPIGINKNEKYHPVIQYIKDTQFLSFLIDKYDDIHSALSFVLHNKDKIGFSFEKIKIHPDIWNKFNDYYGIISTEDLKAELEGLINEFIRIEYPQNPVFKSLDYNSNPVFAFFTALCRLPLLEAENLIENNKNTLNINDKNSSDKLELHILDIDIKVAMSFSKKERTNIMEEYSIFDINSGVLKVTIDQITEVYKLTKNYDYWAVMLKEIKDKIDQNNKSNQPFDREEHKDWIRKFIKDNSENMVLCYSQYTSWDKMFNYSTKNPLFVLRVTFAKENTVVIFNENSTQSMIIKANEGLLYVDQNDTVKVFKVSQTFEYWVEVIDKLKCEWLTPIGVDKNKELSDFLEQNKDKMIEIRTINKK